VEVETRGVEPRSLNETAIPTSHTLRSVFILISKGRMAFGPYDIHHLVL